VAQSSRSTSGHVPIHAKVKYTTLIGTGYGKIMRRHREKEFWGGGRLVTLLVHPAKPGIASNLN
jgi:hypothetical protein